MYKYPDKNILALEYKLKFKEMFLKENNLKIGDEVTLEFPMYRISYDRRGKNPNKVTFYKTMSGILKEFDDGRLYAETIELLPHYKLETLFRRGKWIEFYSSSMKKSIIEFGKGFI